MRAASDIPLGESARFSASLDEQLLSEVEVCTPSEVEVCTPSEAEVCTPSEVDVYTPSEADVCTPSGAEGWDCYYDAAPMGLVHPERSRVHPERSRGVGLLL